MKLVSLATFASLFAFQCAAIELVAPEKGAMVALVPDAQKKVMSLPTLEERLKFFAEDKANGKVFRHDKFWRKAKPLVLKWNYNENERGPWKIEIGKSPDLSDARVWFFKEKEGNGKAKAEQPARKVTYEVPLANLEIASEYYWRVTCKYHCSKAECKRKCSCPEGKKPVRSEIASFRTEDLAPRWIVVDGRVGNIRDFGGRHTSDGRRVKQGMAFRGQGLNDNSITGESQGRNRLTVEDVRYFTNTLGIRTDLDLRSKEETADLAESPLGPGVTFIQRSSSCYRGIFSDSGKKIMAENFRTFCDRKNYPIYFHCIGGADRTGSLAYVLNGVLGVDRHEIETDWESTFYPNIPDANPDPNFWCRESHFNNGFAKYGKDGDSWNRRIELYLLDCGITEAEIAEFRSIMLER